MAGTTIEARTGITVFPCTHSEDLEELYCEKLTYHINTQVGEHCVIASVIKRPKPYELANMGDALLDMMRHNDNRRMMFMVMYGIAPDDMEDSKKVLLKLADEARAMNARPYFFIVDDNESTWQRERYVDISHMIEDLDTKIELKAV